MNVNYEKEHLAVVRFLAMTGREILSDNFMGTEVIVVKDDEGIGFVDVDHDDGIFRSMYRGDFEDLIKRYFMYSDLEDDAAIRYDICRITVLREDRAIIRYHVNAPLRSEKGE